jgi:predicted DNA-binding transcriptional regulator AlpA
MKIKRNFKCLDNETNEQWKQTIEMLIIAYLVKHRKRFIENYITQNFSVLMGEDRLLTSEEVLKMLQISRQTLGRRIKAGLLVPTNPEAKRNYRVKKSAVVNYIDRKKGGKS